MFNFFENNNEKLLFQNTLSILNDHFPECLSYNILSMIYFKCNQCNITFKDNIQVFKIGNKDEIIITCFICSLYDF